MRTGMLIAAAVVLLAGLRLGQAVAADMDNGMVAVGRGTPVLDGRLDDDAWRGAIALTPFLLSGQYRFASEATVVRLLWDERNLYLGFRCRERALEPMENRLHTLKRAVKKHDDKAIFTDDCVTLLLADPARPESVWELTASVSGALSDSVSPVGDIWGKRDLSWESGARSAVTVNTVDGDGAWNVEIALPWAALGGTPPVGKKFSMLVGRFEKSAGEVSSFQYVRGAGMHDAANFGTLQLLDAVPGVTLNAPPTFVPGGNRLGVTLNARTPVELGVAVRFGDAAPLRTRRIGKTGTMELPFELAANGEFTWRWTVGDAADFTTFFQSPRYRFRVSAARLESRLTDAELTVNGHAAGSSALLVSGCNLLTVRPGAKARGELIGGGRVIAFPEGWIKNTQTGHYELRLLSGVSELWPNWSAAGVAVNRGGVQQLLFPPRGVKGMTLRDYAMYFDLPERFSAPGASGYYTDNPLEFSRVGNVDYAGRRYQRYRIALKNPVEFAPELPGHRYIAFLFGVPEDYSESEAELYYHIGSVAAGVRELPNVLKVKILPRLDGRQPRQLGIKLAPGWLGTLENQRLYSDYGRLFAAAGVTETAGLNNRYPGIRHLRFIDFLTWNLSCEAYLAAHPERARVRFDGQPQRSPQIFVCSREIVDNPEFERFLRGALKTWYEKWQRPHHVQWDFEGHVLENELACFCMRCREDFRKQYQLPSTPTATEIRDRHLPEWTAYQNQRVADVATVLRRTIRAVLPPETVFSIYSGYQSAETRRIYGVDWTLLKGRIDLAECGYGRPEAELAATRLAIGATPLRLGEIVYPYRVEERSAPGFAGAAALLRRACDSTAGILVYCFDSLDGRSFSAMAQVSRVMAAHEELFRSGERIGEKLQVRGWERADCEWMVRDGKMLVALMNPTAVRRDYEFVAPVPLRNFFTGEAVSGTVRGGIAPYGIAVFNNDQNP